MRFEDLMINYNYYLPMKSEIRQRPQSKQARSARPVSKHVNSDLARQCFEQGKQEQGQSRLPKAIELYLKATMYDPNFFQAYCNIGTCYRSLRRFNDSRKYYRKAIAINPDDAISRYNLGNAERLLGNYEESIVHYKYVIALKEVLGKDVGSLYLNSLVNLGISYKNKDLFDQASNCYEKVLKLNPSEQSAYFNYAMCIVCSLHCTDNQIFHEVTKEKAEKATRLFSKVKELNQESQMAEFQILRMSVLIDPSEPNLEQKVEQLKQIQQKENCYLKEEIEMELANCMKLMQEFQKSDQHFRQSLQGLRKRSSHLNQYDGAGFPNDSIEPPGDHFNEESALRLIEDGKKEEVEKMIQTIQDSNSGKHVLALTLALLQVDQDNPVLDKPMMIYEKYFRKEGEELPMESISIGGHKAIGHLLSLRKRYNQSIQHFEYAGQKIQSEQERAMVHSSLGNDYQALGDIDKALQEYKKALRSQPESFELHYNIGCCLFDEQNYDEAMTYFERFLGLVRNNFDIKQDMRNIYVADCKISMASCKLEQEQADMGKAFNAFKEAWEAVKVVKTQNIAGFQLEERKMLAFYLGWADILQEKLDSIQDKKSDGYIGTKEVLLEVYINLLEIPHCPDRDIILNNCATIYYEEKLYLNALTNFNQISDELNLSYNNIAVTYLNLHEHYMANKFIHKATEDTIDIIETFNKGIVTWVYSLDDQPNPLLASRLPNRSDMAMLNRLQYAKMLIDVITTKLGRLEPGYSLEDLTQSLNSFAEQDMTALADPADHPKIKALTQVLSRPIPKASDEVDPKLLALSLAESQDPEKDLNYLINQCMNMSDQVSQNIFESLLNLFIFTNRSHSESLSRVLQKWAEHNQQVCHIDFDRIVTIQPQSLVRQFEDQYAVQSVNNLVAHFINWESELQSKLVIILKTIEKYYYKALFKKPMEYQYHFPRHASWAECAMTANKIAFIVLSLLKGQPEVQLKGKTLEDMYTNVYKQLDEAILRRHKTKERMKLELGEEIVPLTVYTYFVGRDECLKFVREIQKESSKKHEVEVGQDCDEIKVVISGVVRLVCLWEETTPFMAVIRSFTEHRLPLPVQAAIGIDSDLESIKDSSQNIKEMLEKHKLFNR